MNQPIKYKESKQILVVIILFLVMMMAAYPRPAHAIPVKVIANLVQIPFDTIIAAKGIITAVQTTLNTINTTYLQIKEAALDKIAWITSKIQLAQEATKIISLVQSGRQETGLGLFVQDWELVGNLQRTKATNLFLRQLSSSNIDPAFKGTLQRSFSTNPYGRQSVFSRLRPTFKDDVRSHPGCEDGSCDTRAFLNDFSKGGWLGFQSLTNNPAHNPFTAYNILLQDKTEREERAKQAALDEARASQGFLGTQDCPPEPQVGQGTVLAPPSEPPPLAVGEGTVLAPPPEESIIESVGAALKTARCKITRPGSSIQADAAQAFGSLHQTLANANEIFEIIGALQGIVGSARESGFSRNAAGTLQLQKSREDINTENINTATEESDRIIAKAQIMLSSVYTVWKKKEQSLNANAELKAALEKIVTNRNLCAIPDVNNNDQSDIAINAEFDLLDVNERDRELGKEVGFGNAVGTFAVGGAHALSLAEKLADAQFVVAIVKNPATIPASQVAQNLRRVFETPPNDRDTEARRKEARQRLGGTIAELEFAMAPFQGAIEQSAGELKQIRLEIEQVKRNQKACGIS